MPETTENFHWVPVRDAGLFVQDSFRQITLSEDQGIHARIGKLKSDPEGSTIVQAYYFDKSKFTMSEAEKWVKDNKKSRQRRIVEPENSEIRVAVDKSNGPVIRGYGAVFNQRTQLYQDFWEEVAPGAFGESLKRDNVYSLWQHNWSQPLGDVRSGTLRLWEDQKGLVYEVMPGDTSYALDLVKNAKRGVVRQSSFGFDIVKQMRTVDKETREVTRTILEARLYDVGPVTNAAYPQTEGLNVRMARDDQGIVYLDGDEVVVVPNEVVPQPNLTAEELDVEWQVLRAIAAPRKRQ